MDYIIGIDSGGTYFRIKACLTDGTEVGFIKCKSIGYYSEDPESFMYQLFGNLDACLAKFQGVDEDCCYLLAGIAGIDSTDDKRLLEENLHKRFKCNVECFNDAELAHLLINKNEGLLLNSGTGTIAYGISLSGERKRIGGWPLRVFGDEGSGAWIALKALRLVGKSYDGLIEDSCLVSTLKEKMNFTSVKDYVDFAMTYRIDQLEDIPPLVDSACEAGDLYAFQIIDDAAKENCQLVVSLARLLGYDNKYPICVNLWGSNILKSKTHYSLLMKYISFEFPNVHFYKVDKDLVDYIVNEALRKCNH